MAHAYKNERGFLDYEFARAKVIEWGESAYAEERYICTQSLFAQLFPGANQVEEINLVGGGVQAALLAQATADADGSKAGQR